MKRLSIRVRFTLWRSVIIALVLPVVGISFSHYDQRILEANSRSEIAQAMVRAQATFNQIYYPSMATHYVPRLTDAEFQITSYNGDRVYMASSVLTNQPALARVRVSHTSSSGLVPVLQRRHATRFIDVRLHLGVAIPLTKPGCVGDGCTAVEFGWYFGSAASQSLAVTQRILITSFLVLWLLGTLLIWLGVGAALAPIEAIRRRVSSITAGDLSERVEVSEGNDEFSRLAVTVNDMLGRLEESAKRQQEFVSNASHELRSPLSTLLATVDLAAANSEKAD